MSPTVRRVSQKTMPVRERERNRDRDRDRQVGGGWKRQGDRKRRPCNVTLVPAPEHLAKPSNGHLSAPPFCLLTLAASFCFGRERLYVSVMASLRFDKSRALTFVT